MKSKKSLLLTMMLFLYNFALAQCSVCTKTAQQLGEKPAKALNNAIIYLMMAPFAIIGVIAYRWWRNNKAIEEEVKEN